MKLPKKTRHAGVATLALLSLVCFPAVTFAEPPGGSPVAPNKTAPAWRAVFTPDQVERLRLRVQARLDELHAANGFPGATVAFVLPDGSVHAVATGMSSLEKQRPMQPNDRMLAGSIGKTFFAAVVMQLIQQKKLGLDDKIGAWLATEPWFNRLPNADDITVRMLMNHTSGIPEHAEAPEFVAALRKDPDKTWSPEEILAFTLDKRPLFPAGQGWSYADTNYIVLGIIAEKILAKPFYDEVQIALLDPLKLKDTIPSTSRTLPGLITGYLMPQSPFGFEGPSIRGGRFVLNPQFEWTGGGFVSTSSDLARWAKDVYEGKAFDKSLLTVVEDGVPAATGKGDKYGLGVQIRQTEYGVTYGHGGWFPGYLSEMEYFPEYKLAIAVQINTDNFRLTKGPTHKYILEMAKVILKSGGRNDSNRDSRKYNPPVANASAMIPARYSSTQTPSLVY